MMQYIQTVQENLISEYGFDKGENGCPQDVPDGAYPMMIDGDLDLVLIINGTISCCNLVGQKDGLKQFIKKEQERRQRP